MRKSDKFGTFVIVDNDSFEDFGQHKSRYREQNPKDVMVPKCQLLLYWMAETESVVHKLKEYGRTYFVPSESDFVALTWRTYKQQKRQQSCEIISPKIHISAYPCSMLHVIIHSLSMLLSHIISDVTDLFTS